MAGPQLIQYSLVTVTIEQWSIIFLKIACLRRVNSADLGTRLIIFGQNEKLVQYEPFALTKLYIYKQTVKVSATTAEAVQKKGTRNKNFGSLKHY
jgi:hypothetical protein